MNLKELKDQINSIPDDFDSFTVIKSHSMSGCKIDKYIKVIYI